MIKCFNFNGFRHMAKECRAPKRRHDSEYQKEKMLLCKKEAYRGQLSVEKHDWLIDSYEELEDQELKAHYIYMAKIQEVLPENAQDMTYPGNPGRLVAGDRFPGRHAARETSNRKARMGYLPGRQRQAYIVSVKQLSDTVEGFPGRHVAREA
nr:hypothetical protein [Tanacetum cinerariifolium]